jgi:hypothetical protein
LDNLEKAKRRAVLTRGRFILRMRPTLDGV